MKRHSQDSVHDPVLYTTHPYVSREESRKREREISHKRYLPERSHIAAYLYCHPEPSDSLEEQYAPLTIGNKITTCKKSKLFDTAYNWILI